MILPLTPMQEGMLFHSLLNEMEQIIMSKLDFI